MFRMTDFGFDNMELALFVIYQCQASIILELSKASRPGFILDCSVSNLTHFGIINVEFKSV